MTIKLRYKNPDGDVSKLIEKGIVEENIGLQNTSDNFRFSAAVAEFGLLLRNSAFKQNATYNNVISLATQSKGKDANGYRDEFIGLVKAIITLPLAKK